MGIPVAFEVKWSGAERAAVHQALTTTVLPPAPPGTGWNYGCDAVFLDSLRTYWLNGYDWEEAERTLNRFPQFLVEIDGLVVHFVHVRGESQRSPPLLLTHGWPGSHYEFWDVIEPLAFPSRFGGNAADAFDIVVPSLPGFGFSGKPETPISQRATAAIWNKLMTEILGYPRYLAQGGDWGGIVTSWMGLDHGKHVCSIHLNLIAFQAPIPAQDEADGAWMAAFGAAQQRLGGYSHLQATKPQSIAWAVAGNPLGQAAWIIERFHDWSDLRQRPFESVFSKDFLITNALLYIMTGSFTTAAWYYLGIAADGGMILPPGIRCETATAIAAFPGDALLPVPPRGRAEKAYNIVRWTDMPRGGHFAASEEPQLFISDVRSWAHEAWAGNLR